MARHKLLPKALLKQIPPLGSTAADSDPLVICKFFFADSSWTWYVIEFDGEDLFYGLVDGFFAELGHFRLSELTSNRGKLGLPIERDLYFEPQPLSEVRHLVDGKHERSE